MYYQVFYKRSINSNLCQISCDSWHEVQLEVERLKKPKFVNVEYHNEQGIFAYTKTIYHHLKERYITYKKIKIQ